MEESKGEVKHLLLGKFNEGLSGQQIEESIKQYANLVNLIPSMKAFTWGKVETLHQGFTHVFESTFESTQGIAEYLAHLIYSDISQLEKLLDVDFKPTKVQP